MNPAGRPRQNLAHRFWSKVDRTRPDGCWPFTAGKTLLGYGKFSLPTGTARSKSIRAHRVAYELAIGPIPLGYDVCHHCDYPLCCRPDHLFIGTDHDNMLDKVLKGRHSRGMHHGMAKLTDDLVRQIRSEYRRGVQGRSTPALARRYGVSAPLIGLIARRKIWAHVL